MTNDPFEIHRRVMSRPEYAAARDAAEAAQRDIVAANERLREATSVVTTLYDDEAAKMREEQG